MPSLLEVLGSFSLSFYAHYCSGDLLQVVEVLLKAGAKVNEKNRSGKWKTELLDSKDELLSILQFKRKMYLLLSYY